MSKQRTLAETEAKEVTSEDSFERLIRNLVADPTWKFLKKKAQHKTESVANSSDSVDN